MEQRLLIKKRNLIRYHFCVYSPTGKKQIIENIPLVAELGGVTYPYRNEEFNIAWLEFYHPQPDRRYYWDINTPAPWEKKKRN